MEMGWADGRSRHVMAAQTGRQVGAEVVQLHSGDGAAYGVVSSVGIVRLWASVAAVSPAGDEDEQNEWRGKLRCRVQSYSSIPSERGTGRRGWAASSRRGQSQWPQRHATNVCSRNTR